MKIHKTLSVKKTRAYPSISKPILPGKNKGVSKLLLVSYQKWKCPKILI